MKNKLNKCLFRLTNDINHSTYIQKVLSNSGETIAETLVSLLVSTLALTMLAGAITTTSNIVTKSRQTLNSYYEQLDEDYSIVKMEKTASESSEVSTATIKITQVSGGIDIEDIGAYYYFAALGEREKVTDDKKIFSYRKK